MRITHNARHEELGRRSWWYQTPSLKRNNLQEYFEIAKKADDELLSSCLVMHEFTLALVGSINTFILYHYLLRRMLLVASL